MAETSSLVLKFGTMGGEKTWTIKNFNPEASVERVKELMDTMITNGSVYKYPPLEKVSAVRRIVEETSYDLSDQS